ncbi:uncharacterized protein LOC109846721 [Asparagus officinalis]|uniref:uncharacterized protein LOC109846721 n=1 Tax=Asparagus officinalis TaxID=4686 RepID=UPI00098E0CED|nr:uncharacterized protein LOC109846721 [Asparagus officinalis]
MTNTTVDSPTSSRIQVADPIVIESDPKPTFGEIRTLIFSGQNYNFWRIKMMTIFRAHDLWKLVEKGFEVPEDEDSLTPTEQKTLKLNYMRDAKVLGLIQMSSPTPSSPGSPTRRQQRRRGASSEKSIVEVKRCNKSKSSSKKFISLSSRYDSIVSVIEETKDMEKLSLQEAIASIKAFDQKLEKRNEASTMERAFQSFNMSSNQQQSQKQKKKKKGGKPNFAPKPQQQQQSGNSQQGSKSACRTCGKSHQGKCWFEGKPKCTNCSRFGHTKE